MSEITITIGGTPVTKIAAARAVSVLYGDTVTIVYKDSDGDEHDYVSVRARYRAYGEIQPAEVSWRSPLPVPAADARAFAAAVTLAAEIAELADQLATEPEEAAV